MKCVEIDIKPCQLCVSGKDCLIERWTKYLDKYLPKNGIIVITELIKDTTWYSQIYMEKALELSYPKFYNRYTKLIVLK